MNEPRPKRNRLVLLFLATALALGAVRLSGLSRGLNAATLEATMREAGPLGVLVFIGAFVLGVLAYLPGAIFVAADTLAYGKLLGFFINLFAGFLAVCASFGVARAIGGQQLDADTSPRIHKLLKRIERRPVLTLALIRAVMFISPPLNTALALSRIRFRDFALGSAVGLILPMAVTTFALNWLMDLPAFARATQFLFG